VSTGSGVPRPTTAIQHPANSPPRFSATTAARHGHHSPRSKRWTPAQSSATWSQAGSTTRNRPSNNAACATVRATRAAGVVAPDTRNHCSTGCIVHATDAWTPAPSNISGGPSGASPVHNVASSDHAAL
jgi:hypothetical protein